MKIAKQIEMARKMLIAGNRSAYARLMSGSIRAAASERTANAIRKAIREDAAERLFVRLNTSCPLAA